MRVLVPAVIIALASYRTELTKCKCRWQIRLPVQEKEKTATSTALMRAFEPMSRPVCVAPRVARALNLLPFVRA